MGTLWIIGMMGSGKSTIAREVARLTEIEAIDCDEQIEARSGRSIADWFAHDEAGFRRRERELVDELLGTDAVVACGGGIVLDDDAVSVMRGSGTVVLLDVPLDVLTARIGSGGDRPLLGPNPAGDLESIAIDRAERYQAAAHVTVDASGSPEQVAEEVVTAWKNWS